ncbi:MAG: riboflavin synthase [Legionellaceae bacterium]|nr:riboflavin synthase [Legionellaceae bacterium]
MFTGIIEAKAETLSIQAEEAGFLLTVAMPLLDIVLGESIAIQGVCLTVQSVFAETAQSIVQFSISPETAALTTLGALQKGHYVNIERALRAGDRFGGHYVTGHVETTATLVRKIPFDTYVCWEISGFKAPYLPYCHPKGSITIDGVSLTINTVSETVLTVMLVPHTLAVTVLGEWQEGQHCNIEFDTMAKMVFHSVQQWFENYENLV